MSKADKRRWRARIAAEKAALDHATAIAINRHLDRILAEQGLDAFTEEFLRLSPKPAEPTEPLSYKILRRVAPAPESPLASTVH